MRRVIDGALAFTGAVLIWQLIVWLTDVPPFILPGPARVAQSMIANRY